MDNWRILNAPTTDRLLMPNFGQGFFYIDLCDTSSERKEAMVDISKLSLEKERIKHFKKLRETKNRMPRVKPIVDYDYVVRPMISPDGRTLAIAGSYYVYFIDPITLELVL
jgi:hypothetical protein